MKTAIFDIETDGFLHVLSTIHCLVIKEAESGKVYSCSDHEGYIPVEQGLKMLAEAERVVGHNIIKFDIPAIQKLHPWFKIDMDRVHDTLLYSRLAYPELGDRDTGLIKARKMPPKMRGRHGLEAWGYRLKLNKGDYAKQRERELRELMVDRRPTKEEIQKYVWGTWTQDMQDYCELDVEVTTRLWDRVVKKNVPPKALELEHWFCYVIGKQERFGYFFDTKSAVALYSSLAQRRVIIDDELQQLFPPWYVNVGRTVPKRDNSRFGYVEGCSFNKVKLQDFNPASRQQIADRLIHLYGWKPSEFTESGQPKVDETTLGQLDNRPAKLLAERFMIEKRIGQLAEGDQAWLKAERNGRIYGSVNTIGAVTGRCTHSHPNVAQVPSNGAPFGKECRALFTVPKGYKQVGCDASGLELRCLAHFMARYDEGAYAKVILSGKKEEGTDIHTMNQKAAGLPTRDNAKTFIYAFLYGAGDEKIGQIIGKGSKAGKKLKENFLAKTPALKKLRDAVAHAVEKRGYLLGIDGRKLYIRSPHAALNTLLQSAGALLVKQATINLYLELSRRGYVWGEDWAMVAHVHDEYQLQVREELVEEVSEVAVWSFREAGKQFNWRCPLDGEAKVGNNWSECH